MCRSPSAFGFKPEMSQLTKSLQLMCKRSDCSGKVVTPEYVLLPVQGASDLSSVGPMAVVPRVCDCSMYQCILLVYSSMNQYHIILFYVTSYDKNTKRAMNV